MHRLNSSQQTRKLNTLRASINIVIIIIINVFVWRHKVITSEALGPGSVLLSRGKRERPGEEECL